MNFVLRMDSAPVKNKNQNVKKTRSKTPKKGFDSSENKIMLSNATNKTSKKKRSNNNARGVIYLGHIPHGFYEDEMKNYFSQFGKVLNTCVARSKKTGRSKGYGFVEFRDEEVAKIAAETMNNYLMFNRIIKCRYIPPEERKSKVFEGKISTKDYPRKTNRIINIRNNKKLLSKLTQKKYLSKAEKKINEFKKFFEERGIDFSFTLGKNSSDDNEEGETVSKTNSEFVSEDEEGEHGVLEIDESENEISFKTPPMVKKVIKKSLNSSAINLTELNNSQKEDKKISLLKKNINKTNLKEKKKEKSKKNSQGVSQKLGKKSKEKEKLVKSLKAKKKLLLKEAVSNKKKTSKTVGNGPAKVQSTKQGSQIERRVIKKNKQNKTKKLSKK